MQISTTSSNLSTINKTQNIDYSGLSASKFMEQLGTEISELFEELSVGLDDETKFKRAMSISLHLSHPMFMQFESGSYPEGMPSDVRSSLESQRAEYESLSSEKEQMIYKMDWMLDHIGFEQTNDLGAEQFIRDLREAYSGVSKSDYKSRDEMNEDDSVLQQFKNDLMNKGAAKFLTDFNQEKIDKMVEEYRRELEKMLEENPEMDIEKMVSDFKKDLLEKLALLEEEEGKSPIHLSRIEFEVHRDLQVQLEDIL